MSTATTTPVMAETTANMVNINPKAEDCYYYFYSNCSKVLYNIIIVFPVSL